MNYDDNELNNQNTIMLPYMVTVQVLRIPTLGLPDQHRVLRTCCCHLLLFIFSILPPVWAVSPVSGSD